MSTGRKLMSRGGGIGESAVTSTANREEFDTFDDGLPARETWTWGGKTADRVVNSHLLPWESTDQCIQMRVQEQIQREMERGGRIGFGADPIDKNDQARKDAFDEYRTREATKKLDYKTILKNEKGKGEGFAHMYVPENQVDEYRGQDGFEPCLNADGAPVKWKDQILTARPKSLQASEDRRDEQEARRNIDAMQIQQKEAMKKQLRDAKVSDSFIPTGDFGAQDDISGA
jgi:hypothetical protein